MMNMHYWPILRSTCLDNCPNFVFCSYRGGEKFEVYKNAIKRTSLLSIHLNQTDLVDEGLLHGQENIFCAVPTGKSWVDEFILLIYCFSFICKKCLIFVGWIVQVQLCSYNSLHARPYSWWWAGYQIFLVFFSCWYYFLFWITAVIILGWTPKICLECLLWYNQ